ncbi:MAG: PAS domain S-box protein [Phycisphaerales bacterium]|nr:PAS domain S-box protein [Phycisphaerales bacterium]
MHLHLGSSQPDRSPKPGGPTRAGSPVEGVAAGSAPEASADQYATLLRQMVENLSSGAVFIEGDQLYMNAAAEELTGYRGDELSTVDEWFSVLFGNRREEVRRKYESHRQRGFDTRSTTLIVRKDGQERRVEFTGSRWNTHEIWLLHDETELAQAARALKESELRLQAILDTAVEGIITADHSGLVISFNRAAAHIFGYTPDEILGQNISMLMPPSYRQKHTDYIEQYLKARQSKIIGVGMEIVAQRKDGTTFPIELAISEIDHLHIFTGVLRDISDRKEIEARLMQGHRLSAIGTLAAGLGHDMNNILLPVRARLDLIDHAGLPDAVQEHFVEIRKSTKYLQDLADGLHLLVMDSGDSGVSEELTSLNDWWEQVHSLLGRALPKEVLFTASIPSDLPEIRVAPHQLTQAVLNMLVNSGKAVGADGRVELWADVDEDNQCVRLGVTDNGSGMSDEVRHRAIEPFFTTQSRGLGTGLGLSLVHRVVQASGGTIEIQSEVGKGTTIILKFPEAPQQSINESSQGTGRPPLAIISVQDPRTGSIAESLLSIIGFDVEPANADADATDHAALWIIDASVQAQPQNLDRVRQCLTEGCRVIVLGALPPEWESLDVQVVENPNDFFKLRAAIELAADEVSQ